MAPTRKAYATADEQQRLLLQFLIGNSLVWGKNINPLSGDNSYNIPLEGDGLAESEFGKELYENVTFGNIVDNLPRNQMIPNLDNDSQLRWCFESWYLQTIARASYCENQNASKTFTI